MTNFVKLATIFIFCLLFHNGNTANILALMGCPSYSHHLWNEVIIAALAERGHTLTIVSVDINKSPNDNVSYIHLEATYEVMKKHYETAEAIPKGPLSNVRMLYDFQMLTCKGILASNGFQEAMKLDDVFDLILYDISVGPCLLRLIQNHPYVPVVGVSAFKMTPEILNIVGGHNYPSYVPLFANQLDVPMNLWRRLYNTGTYVVSYVYRKYISDEVIDTMVKKQFSGENPSLDSLYERLEVILVNTHSAIDQAQSLPPSVIEVGGLHIKEPQPLPEEIEEFIERAERGAVLISLGTNIKAETLGEQRLEAFVNVIKRLDKFNFLWKVETEGLIKTIPKNLLMRKWLPQNDILAHPNVKGFFTHAGGLSIQEATWHGVPVTAMPFFIDQINNAHGVEVKGCGRVVDFEKLTEVSLFQGIFGVIHDETYRNNMLQIRQQFRDRQNKPLDTAIWWIEYALRNPRADHLISSSRNMSYFVTNSLDVILIGVVICSMFLINLWIVLRNIKGTFSKPKATSNKLKPFSKKKVKKN